MILIKIAQTTLRPNCILDPFKQTGSKHNDGCTRAAESGRAQAPIKARELMEQLNADAGKLNIWVRTELNAPAQRAWFTDTGGKTGAGELAPAAASPPTR